MSRDHSRINIGIWNDPDWRLLPPAPQHLYMTLWTAPDRTYAGTYDWRPNRICKLSNGYTPETLNIIADCLQARYFLVVDEETEEALIRSWVRFDGLMRQPRMAVSFASAYASVASATLRQVLAHETKKLRDLEPDLACWKDNRVAQILDHPAVSAKDLATPKDPFADGFGDGLALGLLPVSSGFGPNASQGLPPVCTPPTTATTTSTTYSATQPSSPTPPDEAKSASRKRPATKLPEDWKPTEKHLEKRHDGIDVEREAEKFRLHAEANDRRQVNWNAAFSQWLLNARPDPSNVRPLRPETDDQGRIILPPLPSKSPWGSA